MNKRAVIYARVSRAYKEDDDRITIESQLADCEAYCKQRGYMIIGQYVDKDKYRARRKLVNPSGTRKDRPAYTTMLKAARASEVDVIIAWREDRLYRGMYAAMPLSEMLDETRGAVTVELVKETFDQKMLGIKASIGKLEIDGIRERMVMGRRARIERGEVPGGPCRYGYQKGEDKRLMLYETEAAIVRQVFEWYNQGSNNMEIRARLTSMGIPPRINKVWSKMSIQNILTFEGYATGEYITTLDGESFAIPCPPIISLETWQKALDMRASNKSHRSRNVKEDYLCRGLVTCLCGWKMNARTCHSQREKYGGGRWGYYSCTKNDHQPEQRHPDCAGSIGSKKLDSFVWNFVMSICKNPAIIQEAIDKKIEYLRDQQENVVDEAERLQRELDNLQSERDWVVTMARKKLITEEDMQMQLGALHFQALELRKKHQEALAATAAQSQAERLKAWAETYLIDVGHALRLLETDVTTLSDKVQDKLYEKLEANRFESKYEGDKQAALKWAIFEEKRRVIKTIVSSVLVVKGSKGEKLIIPQLVLEIPLEFASLVYDSQSLIYVEEARKFSEGD
jgi:site-specific DNA recombinase